MAHKKNRVQGSGLEEAKSERADSRKNQGETNEVFTLMISEVSIRTHRISASPKTGDMSDLPFELFPCARINKSCIHNEPPYL
jgi:hypothetical protein